MKITIMINDNNKWYFNDNDDKDSENYIDSCEISIKQTKSNKTNPFQFLFIYFFFVMILFLRLQENF